MLIAAGLLISGQVKADEVTATTYAQLKSYIEGATGECTINVASDLTGADPITIQNGQVITLKLSNDATITLDAEETMIYLKKGTLDVTGAGTLTGTCSFDGWMNLISIWGSTDPLATNYSVLYIREGVKATCKNTVVGVSNNGGYAYGVKVYIEGYVYSDAGPLSVNGSIQATTGNVPEITISGTAACSLQNFQVPEWDNEWMDPCTIYAAGYAIWNISGTVTGCLPIYAKSGVLNINGATLTVTQTVAEGEYVIPQPNGSGCTGGQGSAIVLDSKNGYAGKMELNISGNTTITASENAYALDELKTDATASKTDAVIISGGTINGNINTTAEVKSGCVLNGTITGGTFSDKTIKDYVSNVNGVIDVKTSGEETVYVVNGMPSGKDWVTTIAAAGTTDYVKIADKAIEEVTSDKEIAYLNMPKESKVIVRKGAKLAVGEAVLGEEAIIEVEAGGKLVINGTNGLIAFVPENIVLKANADGRGKFVLNPNVKANKTPYATVEYYSNARALQNGYRWDIFVCPFVSIDYMMGNMTSEDILEGKVLGSAYQYWNGSTWVNCQTKQQLLDNAEAFTAIAITNTCKKDHHCTYTMKGQLQGNISGIFNLGKGYNYFGNGYMADMDAQAMMTDIKSQSQNVKSVIWVWNASEQRFQDFQDKNIGSMKDLNGMDFFILQAINDADVELNYESLVWDKNK